MTLRIPDSRWLAGLSAAVLLLLSGPGVSVRAESGPLDKPLVLPHASEGPSCRPDSIETIRQRNAALAKIMELRHQVGSDAEEFEVMDTTGLNYPTASSPMLEVQRLRREAQLAGSESR